MCFNFFLYLKKTICDIQWYKDGDNNAFSSPECVNSTDHDRWIRINVGISKLRKGMSRFVKANYRKV